MTGNPDHTGDSSEPSREWPNAARESSGISNEEILEETDAPATGSEEMQGARQNEEEEEEGGGEEEEGNGWQDLRNMIRNGEPARDPPDAGGMEGITLVADPALPTMERRQQDSLISLLTAGELMNNNHNNIQANFNNDNGPNNNGGGAVNLNLQLQPWQQWQILAQTLAQVLAIINPNDFDDNNNNNRANDDDSAA